MKRVIVLLATLGLGLWLMPVAAQAAPFTGTFAPTVVGGLADLNGSGTISSADSWVDFYDSTDIINGGLDCDNWGATVNDGSDGDGVIDFLDDCELLGYDGTSNGVTIIVSNGSFVEKDGLAFPDKTKLPAVFPNVATPANPSVVQADFAWQAIGGAIDVNQNGLISAADCAEDIVNGWNIVASLCNGVPSSDNGLVDTTDNFVIGTEDDSASGFFGMAITDGVVQGSPVTVSPLTFSPASGPVGTKVTLKSTGLTGATKVEFNGTSAAFTVDSDTQISTTVPTGATDGPIKVTLAGTAGTQTSAASFDVTTGIVDCIGTDGNDTLTGTGGADTCVGKAGNDTIMGKGGPDLLKGNQGDDVLKGGKGDDVLKGGKGFDTCKGGPGNDTIKGCEA